MMSCMGRKRSDTYHDLMFTLLVTLKHGGVWTFFATLFKKNASPFERAMTRLIAAMVGDLESKFVVGARDSCCTMKELVLIERRFRRSSSALYATDVKFHHFNRPRESYQESKLHISGKHRLYRYKTEVSVSFNELAVFISSHFSGFKEDLAIFNAMSAKHKLFTLKRSDESDTSDDESESNSWGILLDKGFVSVDCSVLSFIPRKKNSGRPLTTAKKKGNTYISFDRIIVGKRFGWFVSLWEIVFRQFRRCEEKYVDLFAVCALLTSFHITKHPMRDSDADAYKSVQKKLYAMGSYHWKKKKDAAALP